jgi:hypothetical protein
MVHFKQLRPLNRQHSSLANGALGEHRQEIKAPELSA